MTTPSKDRGDLIREHGERIATLDERIENIRRDIDRILKLIETRKERQWSLGLAMMVSLVGIIGAVIGGVLTKMFELMLTKGVR